MKTIIKILLTASLLTFIQMHVSEQLQMRGRQLAFLRNLPHRYLGMLYYSWMLQPHRNDLLYNYGIEWHIAVHERECLLEGMTKPVVPLLISSRAGETGDENLVKLSKVLNDYERKQRDATKNL